MANFVLSRRKAFTFALEEDSKTEYSLPPIASLSFEDAKLLTEIDEESDIVKRGGMIRDFILSHCPDLKDAGLGDMEFFTIYAEYGKSLGHAQGE